MAKSSRQTFASATTSRCRPPDDSRASYYRRTIYQQHPARSTLSSPTPSAPHAPHARSPDLLHTRRVAGPRVRAAASAPAQRRPHHDRRHGLRRPPELRRHRHPHAEHRPARPRGSAAHRLLRERRDLHSDARGPHHRPLPAARSSSKRRSAPGTCGLRTRSASPRDARCRSSSRTADTPRGWSANGISDGSRSSVRAHTGSSTSSDSRADTSTTTSTRTVPIPWTRPTCSRTIARSQVPGYMTDLITDRSVGFIEKHARRPFFLDVAYNAPHWPYQVPGKPSVARDARTSSLAVRRFDEHACRLRRDDRAHGSRHRPDPRDARPARHP